MPPPLDNEKLFGTDQEKAEFRALAAVILGAGLASSLVTRLDKTGAEKVADEAVLLADALISRLSPL